MLWYEAIKYTTFVSNRTPHRSINYQIPYTLKNQKHYNITEIHPFGKRVIVHTLKSKFTARGTEQYWIRYDNTSKGHRVYNPITKSISTVRNLKFVTNSAKTQDTIESDLTQDTTRKSNRQIKPTNRKLGISYHIQQSLKLDNPLTYTEAINRSDHIYWKRAMEEEITTLQKRGTWHYTTLPSDCKAIGTKFVFKTKRKSNGTIERYKARLVVQGYAQIPGYNYEENDTSAPVVRSSTLRLILSEAAHRDWPLHQLDIKSAYLYGKLQADEEIYLKPPPGNFLQNINNKVLKLDKALYGLKQAGRRWYQTFSQALNTIGFQQHYKDPALFYHKNTNNQIRAFLIIYVDDLTIAADTETFIIDFKNRLSKHFKFSDGGELNWLLGIRIYRNRQLRTITIDQKAYINTKLIHFQLQNQPPKTTPLPPGTKILEIQPSNENTRINNELYMSLVGALRYATDWTRPDLAYAAGYFARFLQNPSQEHLQLLYNCFGYLNATKKQKLTLGGKDKPQLKVYSDTGGQTEKDFIPVGAYIIFWNGLIAWSSKKIPNPFLPTDVSLHVYESEFRQMVLALNEGILIQYIIETLTQKLPNITLYGDNLSAVTVLNDTTQKYRAKIKQFKVNFFYLHSLIQNNYITITHVPGTQQLADPLTKSLTRFILQRFKEHIFNHTTPLKSI